MELQYLEPPKYEPSIPIDIANSIKKEQVQYVSGCVPIRIIERNDSDLIKVNLMPTNSDPINTWDPEELKKERELRHAQSQVYTSNPYGLMGQMYPNGYPTQEQQVQYQPQQQFTTSPGYNCNPMQNNNYSPSSSSFRPTSLPGYNRPAYSEGAVNLANAVVNQPQQGADLFSRLATAQTMNNNPYHANVYDPLSQVGTNPLNPYEAGKPANKYIRPIGYVWDDNTEAWVKGGDYVLEEDIKRLKEKSQKNGGLGLDDIESIKKAGFVLNNETFNNFGFKYLHTIPIEKKEEYKPNYNISNSVIKAYSDNPLFGYLRLVSDYSPEMIAAKRDQLIEQFNATFMLNNPYEAENRRRFLYQQIQQTMNPQIFGLSYDPETFNYKYKYPDLYLDNQYDVFMHCLKSNRKYFGLDTEEESILKDIRSMMHPETQIVKFEANTYVPDEEDIAQAKFREEQARREYKKQVEEYQAAVARANMLYNWNIKYDMAKRDIPDSVGLIEFFNEGYGAALLRDMYYDKSRNIRFMHTRTFDEYNINKFIDIMSNNTSCFDFGFGKQPVENTNNQFIKIVGNNMVMDNITGRIHNVNTSDPRAMEEVLRRAQFNYSILAPENRGIG